MGRTVFGRQGSDYTRSYPRFTGVDLTGIGSEISKNRLSYCENIYRDYSGDDPAAVESLPGYRRLADFGKPIRALHCYKHPDGRDLLLVHAADELHLFDPKESSSRIIAEVADCKSRGFQCGSRFYLLFGGRILVVDSEGNAGEVGKEVLPYVPTRYYCGKELEQKNLLTSAFKEELVIEDSMLYSYGSEELQYSINDQSLRTCSVVGCSANFSGTLYVPSVIKLGMTEYKVTEIADWALSYQSQITEIRIAEGVRRIGKFAFRGDTSLMTVYTPKSLEIIDNAAFADCAGMTALYLRTNLSTIGLNAFSGCISLATVYYEGSEAELSELENSGALTRAEIVPDSYNESLTIGIKLNVDAESICEVRANDTPIDYMVRDLFDGKKMVIIFLETAGKLNGSRIVISGAEREMQSSFAEPEGTPAVDTRSAILGCRIAELFDGRVFLSGNPSLPNTVFYSALIGGGALDPLYFGAYDYFSDGIGSFGVKAMLAVRDSLAIFKTKDDGSGSIFYHKGENASESILGRIYPRTYVHSGLCATGDAINFLDDPVFLCPIGLGGIGMKAINYERSVECRSHNVNSLLLAADHSAVTLTEWCGYLCVCIGDTVLMADSRATFTHKTGAKEYEWFLAKGIGSRENATRVYRYSSEIRDGFLSPEDPDGRFLGTVFSEITQEGEKLYYEQSEEGRRLVYPTEELEGGDFYPASAYLGVGDLLYFGTGSGALMIFNNDMRGVPPRHLSSKEDFSMEDYQRHMSRRIHPYYYSFDGHAPRYAIRTLRDDCDVPHLTKSTSKNSSVIKVNAYRASRLAVEIYTDRDSYKEIAAFPAGEWNFAELDFACAVLDNHAYTSLPLGEKEKGWVEKQMNIYSDSFASPIGVISITYRYSVKGRIKPG